MNRTRKIVAAGIGAAVIVVILAMVLMAPNLHTQTPVSTTPPSNGGTGGGGSGGTGTGSGTGSGNGTLANCNVTRDDQESGDQNVTDSSVMAVHSLDDGNQTNETGDHDWGECNATAGDHDSMGDQESEAHRAAAADHGLADELSADVVALVPMLAGAMVASWNALATVSRALVGFLGGLGSSLSVFVTGR
jgi:hypothetical protein